MYIYSQILSVYSQAIVQFRKLPIKIIKKKKKKKNTHTHTESSLKYAIFQSRYRIYSSNIDYSSDGDGNDEWTDSSCENKLEAQNDALFQGISIFKHGFKVRVRVTRFVN